jgi:hypothetical protein
MAVIEQRRMTDSAATRPSIQGVEAIFGRRAFAWGGVWAGAFAAMALQLMCGLLADANAFLLGGQIPVTGISPAAAIWYLVYTFAAMFVAGSIAGQTGGGPGNRALHAFVTWALASVLGFFTLVVTSGQLNIGPVMAVVPEAGLAGLAMVSRGWMFIGLFLGLIGALAGARWVSFEPTY